MNVFSRLNLFCLNLRWLLWRREAEPSKWASELQKMTRGYIEEERAISLLRGSKPTAEELNAISELTANDAEEMESVPLYARDSSVFERNLNYLLNSMPKGEKAKAAKVIGVKPAQLSRWLKNVKRPRLENIRKLLRFHGIDPDIDLKDTPIFLNLEPLSGYAQKKWVEDRVHEMPASEVSKIYPALKKLLREDEAD